MRRTLISAAVATLAASSFVSSALAEPEIDLPGLASPDLGSPDRASPDLATAFAPRGPDDATATSALIMPKHVKGSDAEESTSDGNFGNLMHQTTSRADLASKAAATGAVSWRDDDNPAHRPARPHSLDLSSEWWSRTTLVPMTVPTGASRSWDDEKSALGQLDFGIPPRTESGNTHERPLASPTSPPEEQPARTTAKSGFAVEETSVTFLIPPGHRYSWRIWRHAEPVTNGYESVWPRPWSGRLERTGEKRPYMRSPAPDGHASRVLSKTGARMTASPVDSPRKIRYPHLNPHYRQSERVPAWFKAGVAGRPFGGKNETRAPAGSWAHVTRTSRKPDSWGPKTASRWHHRTEATPEPVTRPEPVYRAWKTMSAEPADGSLGPKTAGHGPSESANLDNDSARGPLPTENPSRGIRGRQSVDPDGTAKDEGPARAGPPVGEGDGEKGTEAPPSRMADQPDESPGVSSMST